MSNKKTLFIIGAGASTEVNLPDGTGLKQEIANLLNIKFDRLGFTQTSGDCSIYRALQIYASQSKETTTKPYIEAAQHIQRAMPQAISIDNFIDSHKGNNKIELCGKLAIARAILEAEKNSSIFIDNSNHYNRLDFGQLEKTWYTNFMKLITENCTKDTVSKRLESVTLIIFNYDRCVEHYIYNFIQNYYDLDFAKTGDLVKKIEIYHPYGAVGALPWQCEKSKDYTQAVNFGSELEPNKLLEVAQKIKTFTEGTDPNSSEISSIRNNVVNADNIVFLGFAYHELNMELLMPNNFAMNSAKFHWCFGTAKEISDANCETIRTELESFYKSVKLNICNNLDCYQLFKEYWRSLSLD